MARLDRTSDTLEASLVVTGTPRAVERVWRALVEVADAARGELELLVAGHALVPEGAVAEAAPPLELPAQGLRLFLHRHPPPEPELPRVGLMASLCANPRTRLVSQVADGLIVALDLDAAGGAQARHLLGVLDDVLPMLEHTVPDLSPEAADGPRSTLPRVVLGLGGEADAPVWRALGELWLDEPDALAQVCPGGVSTDEARALLSHLVARARLHWQRRAPLGEPLSPRADLPASLQAESERCVREASAPDALPAERARALLRQAQLYRRAGRAEAAGVLLREALGETVPEAWEGLTRAVPLPVELQILRRWSLPPASPGGVALLEGGRALLLAIDGALWRLERHEDVPRRLASPEVRVLGVREAGPERALLLGRALVLVDARDGRTLARAGLRAAWRENLGATSLQRAARAPAERPPGQPRVDLDPARDRVLLVLPTGLHLYRLGDLAPLAMLERDDVVAAGLGAGGEVLTVHRGGTLGRWVPGAAIIERVGSLPGGEVRDASVAGRAGRIASLCGVMRRGPWLRVTDTSGATTVLEVPTEQATSVRLSEDGARVLTLEHRLLRVRVVGAGADTAARTLLDPPPWMPVHVDLTADARFVAVLARTYTGLSELRVNLWG